MTWVILPSIFVGMNVIGCIAGKFQYIISYDCDGTIAASAKKYPNSGRRIDLGDKFTTVDAAKEACYNHWKQAHS